MFHTPAHKQTNPAALPAQIVNPVTPTERRLGPSRANHLYDVETRCGTPLEVLANTRTGASTTARLAGFSVCSVNMIG